MSWADWLWTEAHCLVVGCCALREFEVWGIVQLCAALRSATLSLAQMSYATACCPAAASSCKSLQRMLQTAHCNDTTAV